MKFTSYFRVVDPVSGAVRFSSVFERLVVDYARALNGSEKRGTSANPFLAIEEVQR